MDISEQENTQEESKLESSIKNPEELKAKNQETFYNKIDEWRKYFNTLETQGPQVF
ncbi:MAG: hypothetical protein AABX39_02080 [Nanoarchaeota archaeon]